MPRGPLLVALLLGGALIAFVALIVAGRLASARREATSAWAYVGKDGAVVIPGPFEAAGPFRHGLAAVRRGGKWGFVDPAGREVVPPRFEDVGAFSAEGLAPVMEEGRWGYIGRDGAWAIAPRYDRAYAFVDGRAVVGVEVGRQTSTSTTSNPIRSYTLIDPSGAEVRPVGKVDDPTRLEDLRDLSEGLAPAKIGGRWGYVDRHLNVVIAPRWENPGPFSGGLAPVQEGGLWGFVDKTGAVVIPPTYAYADPFREGVARAGIQRDGYLLPDGTLAFEGLFDEARSFSGGLAAVRTAEGWGFVDRTGRFVVQPSYAAAGEGFAEERAAVAVKSGLLGRRWGFVDPTGELVVAPTFLEVDPAGFSEGLCAVRREK